MYNKVLMLACVEAITDLKAPVKTILSGYKTE